MKKILYPAVPVLLFICLSAFIVLTTWKVKEPYEVKFAGGKIHGVFEKLKANIQFDGQHPETSKISASIEAESLSTGFFLKNSHAKEAIDADKYPSISFVSTSVSKSGSSYIAAGRLTLKGVTKPITIHFTFDDKGSSGVFKGGFRIIPKDYGITKNGSPYELNISLTVPVVK